MKSKTLGREFVIQVKGTVIERESKNPNMATGEIEILVSTELTILNEAQLLHLLSKMKPMVVKTFCMKYRYLDIRRNWLKQLIIPS